MYNGRIDLVEHVSHFNQRMTIHSKDEGLMCKVFPSSLGPVAMRWFDSLRADSIRSFKELTKAFGSQFVTCSRVPRPLASLLSLSMREGKTLKTYSDKYWEMFNEIDGDFVDVAISTFKLSLLAKHGLRKSLTGKPITSVRQLMDQINKGNHARRNHNLYCQYHQDHGHTIEDCRSLWDHLDQLVREGKLKQLLHHSSGQGGQVNLESRRDDSSRPPLGMINVIFAALGRTGFYPSRVMSVAWLSTEDANQEPKKAKLEIQPVLGFSDKDKIGTIQSHDDTLVVTLRIGGYDVKMVIVDQGSSDEIMHPDLYKGLSLRPEDPTPDSLLLVSFDGKVVIPKGQIRLPVQTGSEVVEVDFLVMNTYSPYTAIMARPWLHTLGAISSTMHQKIGARLPPLEKEELIEFLKKNVDVFAWSAYEDPGVDLSFICHHLNVNPFVTPKRRPHRCSSRDHSNAIREEVKKLKQAGAIKKVFYPEWLANTVVVKTNSGKWRECVDFTDLNKAFPKDPFLMPKID
nr:uncharacterized protein LOC112015944 [Quercus suber]